MFFNFTEWRHLDFKVEKQFALCLKFVMLLFNDFIIGWSWWVDLQEIMFSLGII